MIRPDRTLTAALVLGLCVLLGAASASARLFFTSGDPALQGAAAVPLNASSGFMTGQLQHTVNAGGLTLDFSTTHPQGMYGNFFFAGDTFAAHFPDGIVIDIAPPAGAAGVHYLGAECFGTVTFEGAAGSETFSTQFGDSDVYIGAADIGDISRIVLDAGCFAAQYDLLHVVAGGGPPPTDDADLAMGKTPAVGRVSQADGSVTWNLGVTNLGPDPSNGARSIDFLPLGTDVVAANPLHVILAGTRIAQQGVGSIDEGTTFPLTLETGIPPFHPDPTVPTIFSCESVMRNVAVATGTSLDANPANNVAVASVGFDTAARSGFPEICGNGADDDCDGRADCSDPSCVAHPTCRPPSLPGPQQPMCLFGGCPFPPGAPPPPPPQPCTASDIHGRPVAIPSHCCALNGPRVNGRSPPECDVVQDPNFKTVDPPVDALGFGITQAGRLHDYAITYENVGTGDALDVHVIDVLDPDLDDATLVVRDGGTYDPATRAITWRDPLPLPPLTPRTVGFEVAVRSNAPDFTAVRNFATVVFPTADPPEFTDTNTVQHLIVPPASFVADPGVVGCQETAPGSGLWTVSLFNKGDAFGWNATAEIVNPPASVDVSDALAAFGALDDFPGAPDRSITPHNTTWSLDTVAFTSETPGDPCRTLLWRIRWEPAPGDPPVVRDVRIDPDADADGVTDADDVCPDDYDPTQADSDGDGTGDACETVVVLVPIDDLAARAKSGKIDLTWTPPAGAATYDVYRSDAGGPLALVAADHVAPFGVYADSGLTDGVEYTYEVVWRDAGGAASAPSNTASATPGGRSRGVPPVCGGVQNEAVVLLAVVGGRQWWSRRRRREAR
ncbi:MAG: hypothetical protein ACQGVC_13265 [Myxococcota bacterium]